MFVMTINDDNLVVSVKQVGDGYTLAEKEYLRESIEADKLGLIYNEADQTFSAPNPE